MYASIASHWQTQNAQKYHDAQLQLRAQEKEIRRLQNENNRLTQTISELRAQLQEVTMNTSTSIITPRANPPAANVAQATAAMIPPDAWTDAQRSAYWQAGIEPISQPQQPVVLPPTPAPAAEHQAWLNTLGGCPWNA